jgi:error-prone DNA polymerase
MERLFVERAQARDMDEATARAIFAQLAGFAGFGFCKSHAASFALIAYQTLYLKRYHPAPFYCALLNHQPMGFYPPEVIVGDARRHGVELLPPDIHHSGWNTRSNPPPRPSGPCAWGCPPSMVWARLPGERWIAARKEAPFAGWRISCAARVFPARWSRTLSAPARWMPLATRRSLLWTLGQLHLADDDLGLETPVVDVVLPPLDALEESAWEYELLGLSPAGQVMVHYREALRKAGVLSTGQVKEARAGRTVWVGGMVVVRQRPPTAGGVAFLSLEDERGLLDVVLKPPVYERYKALLRGQSCCSSGAWSSGRGGR